MDGVNKSVPFVYWADCEDPDQSSMCWHREDALTQINDHGGTLYELSHTSELDAALAREAALQRDHDNWKLKACEAAEREAALREELAEYQKILASYKNNYVTKLAYNAVQSSLTAAEQRNAALGTFMERVEDHFKFWHDHPYAETLHGVIEDYRKTKPTESGASE